MKNTAAILTMLGALSLNAAAFEIGGIHVPTSQGDFSLQGAGLLRKGLFFKIYVGALYLEDENHANDVLASVPKRLDIHYFHHTPKKHMIRVAEKTLRKNLSDEQYKELLPQIEQLHKSYLNGKKGSVASIIHHPGKGLTYRFDERSIITIECDDFAKAYFMIWLGDKPSSRTIKEAMLEGRKG